KLDKENLIFVLNESSSSEEETESGFYFFVNDKDELSDVTEKLNIKTFPVNKINFPCIVRSFVYGDKIKTAEGKYKSLSQIFSDWKIPEKIRGKIPVIEEVFPELKEMPQIKALIAESFGFKNWIVE
ncbi:tRNA lysidine(34) synthetase TilS, partial [Treponema sp.]|uniref:tRNA lysidine(34) synthetase TilS n=1 Tax=Treponema sp. TaxID=166 RepID=UPI00388D11CF